MDIQRELIDIRERADKGGLTARDFEEATFSVSSVGNIGGTYFVPTILRPQAAIMAIGKARKTAKYVEDENTKEGYRFVPQDSINISISADHRVLDGATVTRFGGKIKNYIENPNMMLINMS